MQSRTFQRLVGWSVAHRLMALCALAALTAFALGGLPKLRIDASYDSLIAGDDPERALYNDTVARFGSDYIALVYVRDEHLFTPALLTEVDNLVLALRALSYVEKVESVFTINNVRHTPQGLDITPLMDSVPQTAADIRRVIDNAQRNPFAWGHVLSHDAKALLLYVRIEPGWHDPDLASRAYDDIEALIEARRPVLDSIFQTGPPAIIVNTERALIRDGLQLTPIVAAAIFVVASIMLRTPLAGVLPLLTGALSILLCYGLMGWLGIPLNVLSSMLPVILISVGSTEDLYMVAAYLRFLPGAGPDPRRAASLKMLHKVALVSVLTATTTALGFGVGIVHKLQILKDFSVSIALGLMLNLAVTLVLVPIVLSVAGPRQSKLATGAYPALLRAVRTVLDRIAQGPAGRCFILMSVGLTMACLWTASSVRPTADPSRFLRPDHPLLRANQAIERDFAGTQVFFVAFDGGEAGSFKEPDRLRLLQRVATLIEADPAFRRALSLADQVAFLHREINGGDPVHYAIPGAADLIEQYLLLLHRDDIRAFVSHDLRHANVVVRHSMTDSNVIAHELAELANRIAAATGGAMPFNIVSQQILISRAAGSLVAAMVLSLALVGAALVFLIALVYRSVRLGLAALLPNLLPASLVFALMALLDIPLNPGTAVGAVVVLGIAIDDSLHLLNAYAWAREQGATPAAAPRVAVETQIMGITTTTAALGAGFGICMLSEFVVISQLAMIAALSLVAAMLVDLLVMPAILLYVDPIARKTASPA